MFPTEAVDFNKIYILCFVPIFGLTGNFSEKKGKSYS
jgi:hypothetical protein